MLLYGAYFVPNGRDPNGHRSGAIGITGGFDDPFDNPTTNVPPGWCFFLSDGFGGFGDITLGDAYQSGLVIRGNFSLGCTRGGPLDNLPGGGGDIPPERVPLPQPTSTPVENLSTQLLKQGFRQFSDIKSASQSIGEEKYQEAQRSTSDWKLRKEWGWSLFEFGGKIWTPCRWSASRRVTAT
jgi:hypothetical protein